MTGEHVKSYKELADGFKVLKQVKRWSLCSSATGIWVGPNLYVKLEMIVARIVTGLDRCPSWLC